LRREFDRFVASFIDKIASSPEYAARLETFKRDLIADPRVGDLAEGMWTSFRRLLEQNVRGSNSVLHTHLRGLLIEAGRKLADDPRLRAHINRGMVAVLENFVEDQRRRSHIHRGADQRLGHGSPGPTDRDQRWKRSAVHPLQRRDSRRSRRARDLYGRDPVEAHLILGSVRLLAKRFSTGIDREWVDRRRAWLDRI